MHRPTPCVGICSTTYGDLVCRGCKRFAHEIVEWNVYVEDQKTAIWQRLIELREGAVSAVLTDAQITALGERAQELRVPDTQAMSPASVAYESLRRMARFTSHSHGELLPDLRPGDTPRTLLDVIDQEFFARSQAVYERSFKVPAQ